MGLITEGSSFEFEVADHDGRDRYRFTVERAADELVVRYEGGTGKGTWIFERQAIASATSWLVLSEGEATSSLMKKLGKTIKRDLPPFLLSRDVFRKLKTGRATLRAGSDEDSSEVEIVAKGKAAGSDVVHVTGGGDVDLWVIDDETWPFIVRNGDDDVYWQLLDAKKAVKVTGVKPFSVIPQASVRGEADVVRVLRDASGNAKTRASAIQKAASMRTPETRDALFSVLASAKIAKADYAGFLESRYALEKHAEQPGFADALRVELERSIARSPETADEIDHPHKWIQSLSNCLSPELLSHAPLAELVRFHARASSRRWIQAIAIRALLAANDPITERELLDEAAAKKPMDPERAIHAAEQIGQQPLAELRERAGQLVAKQPKEERDELWRRVVMRTQRPTMYGLVDWMAGDEVERRYWVGRYVAERLPVKVRAIRDLRDAPASIEVIVSLDGALEDQPASALAVMRAVIEMSPPDKSDAAERTAYLKAWNLAAYYEIMAGNIPAAIALVERAKPYSNEYPNIYHNAACAYAKAGDHERALAQVGLAIDHGMDGIEQMEKDEDLAPIANDPRFVKLFADWRRTR